MTAVLGGRAGRTGDRAGRRPTGASRRGTAANRDTTGADPVHATEIDPTRHLDPTRQLDPMRHLVDLHFVAREHIAELLTRPGADTLHAACRSVEHFLASERRLVVFDARGCVAIGVDRIEVVHHRRNVRRALARVRTRDVTVATVTRAVETLRLAFLEHGALYGRPPAQPAAAPPIELPPVRPAVA